MPYTLKDFESVFPSLVEDLTQHTQKYGVPSNALQWYQKVHPFFVPLALRMTVLSTC